MIAVRTKPLPSRPPPAPRAPSIFIINVFLVVAIGCLLWLSIGTILLTMFSG